VTRQRLQLIERGFVQRRPEVNDEFRIFFEKTEPKLSHALAAAYGVEAGRESTSDALAYAWEHWTRVRAMANPSGYLYRVGQSSARRYRRTGPLMPAVVPAELPEVEPRLPAALNGLSASQRTAVVLVHVLGWTEREAASLLGVDRSTIRRHRDRGLEKLRATLEAPAHA
jgi:RNA polymerase sigma factor (sigma-70 family)